MVLVRGMQEESESKDKQFHDKDGNRSWNDVHWRLEEGATSLSMQASTRSQKGQENRFP